MWVKCGRGRDGLGVEVFGYGVGVVGDFVFGSVLCVFVVYGEV